MRSRCVAGSITLGEAAEHTAVLAVACSRCERAGRYSLDTLIARHGDDFGIPSLLRLLSDDCPKRQSITVYDLCGVHCPELPRSSWARRTDLPALPVPCPPWGLPGPSPAGGPLPRAACDDEQKGLGPQSMTASQPGGADP